MSTSGYLFNSDEKTSPNQRQSPKKGSLANSDYSKPNNLDNDANLKYQHLRKWYETRVRGLSEDIKSAFKLVQSDVLIETMHQDSASEEFVNQRVKEIIEDCLTNDRETLLEKMALHCSHLKSEASRIEQENIKILKQQEVLERELNIQIDRLREQYKNEKKEKELLQNEVESLRGTLQNYTKNYEGKLLTMDEQHKKNEEHGLLERHKLENQLRDCEDKYLELTQKNIMTQKEVDTYRTRIREQETELNSLRTEMSIMQGKVKETHRVIEDYERKQHELTTLTQNLKEEVTDLQSEITHRETQRREIENKFRRVSDEMEKEHAQNIDRIHKTHKEKIEQFKKKLLDYKERLTDKEKEAQEAQQRSEAEVKNMQKTVQGLENKLQEQRDLYNHTIKKVKEEGEFRINEIRRQHEDEVREVQEQLKNLLDQKVSQLQDDADEQIQQLKKQESNLRNLLEEKIFELERDYVKRELYNKVIEEKNTATQKLKDELVKKDLDYRQEVMNKLKELEERLTEEHNTKQKTLKAIITENEQQIKDLNETCKAFEQKLHIVSEEKKVLNESVEYFEIQKNLSQTSTEEWELKCRKIKAICDEEQAKRNEVERELRLYQEKFKELNNQLEVQAKELEEKENEIQYLSHEAANLQATLKEGNKERRRIDKEVEERRKEVLELRDALGALQNENKLLGADNNRLNEKIKDIIQSETERYEKEVTEHSKTTNKLKTAEERIENLNNKLDENREQIRQLKDLLDEQEKQIRNLTSKLEESNEKAEDLYREKSSTERRLDKILIKSTGFRRTAVSNLDVLRTELNDMKRFIQTFISSIVRQYELKFFELKNRLELTLERKDREYQQELATLKEKLNTEYNQNYTGLREKHHNEILDIQKENERKYMEWTRQIQYHDQVNRTLTEKLSDAEKEIERKTFQQAQLEKQISEVRTEKELAAIRWEQSKQDYEKQLEEEYEKANQNAEDFAKQKKTLKDRYVAEIESLRKEMDELRESHNDIMKKYDEQLQALTREQEDEVKYKKKDFEETVNHLEISLKTSRETEETLIETVAKLENKIAKLKQKNADAEAEKENLKDVYDRKLELFEMKLMEVNRVIENENQAMMSFKEAKRKEIEEYLNTIQALQEELASKNDKINNILQDRSKLNQQIHDIEMELNAKIDQVSGQKQDLLKRTLQQAKEIEHLHALLAKTYRHKTEYFEETGVKKRDSREKDFSMLGTVNPRSKKDLNRTEVDVDYYRVENSNSYRRPYETKDKSKSMYYDQTDEYQHLTERRNDSKRRKPLDQGIH